MKSNRLICIFYGFVIFNFAFSDDKIWILDGEELQIRMDTKAVIACSAAVTFNIDDYYSWSEGWGFGNWIIRTSTYAELLFDPDPTPKNWTVYKLSRRVYNGNPMVAKGGSIWPAEDTPRNR